MEWVMLAKNICFIKLTLLREKWKSVDMPNAVALLTQKLIGLKPGGSMFYCRGKIIKEHI